MSAVIKCSKCHPGSIELAPDARGNTPYCIGCEDKQAHDLVGKEVKAIAKKRKK